MKHAAFVRARGRHYSNEAEAMKVISSPSQSDLTYISNRSSYFIFLQRAAQMMDDEDEDEEIPPLPQRSREDNVSDMTESADGSEVDVDVLESSVKVNGIDHPEA